MPLGRAKGNKMPNKIVSVTWACLICGKVHALEEAAVACEQLPVEEEVFLVGENVQPLNDSGTAPEQRTCLYHDRQYQAIGTVVKTCIVPPLGGEDTKWTRSLRSRAGHPEQRHCRQYFVQSKCPQCQEDLEASPAPRPYYYWELQKT